MKKVERIVVRPIWEKLNTDDMQFVFMSGYSTNDTIFLIIQLLGQKVILCAGFWQVRWTRCTRMWVVRVNGTLIEMFVIKVGVHQESVLSPLLFIMVLESLSHEFVSRGIIIRRWSCDDCREYGRADREI